ncbi:MAG: T9SS type A sorting domain-containing protein, partial [Ferruginibacter sp.]|nr:T9SS type A sorting domain-containing protein [Ferruginibacter sp.]
SSTPVTNCVVNDGTITINHTGGKGSITFSIDGNNYQPGNVFSGLEEGTYDAYVKDQNVCIGVAVEVQVLSDCSSFSKIKKTGEPKQKIISKIQVGPNPSSSFFNLLVPAKTESNISVQVYDGYGRMVWQQTGKGKGNFKFGSGFAPGIYRIRVVSENQRETLSVIKQ